MPTPTGVPVTIISPGNKVIPAEIVSISVGILKISAEQLESCLSLPFTSVLR